MSWRLPALWSVLIWAGVAGAAEPAPLPPGMSGDASGAGQQILAHGEGEQFWIAVRERSFGHPGEAFTGFYVRSLEHPAWHLLSKLEGAALLLASRGGQLAVLMPGGDWMLLWEGGGSGGAPLPAGARIVAMGNDAQNLWAIGAAAGNAASLAVSRPATPTTHSGQDVPPVNLVLFRLEDGRWNPWADLPAAISPGSLMSFGSVGGTPHVVYQDATDSVRVVNYQAGEWGSPVHLSFKSPVVALKLLSGTGLPILWVATRQGPDALYFLETTGTRSAELRPFATDPAQRTVAFAGGRIRLLWLESDRLWQQDYDSRTGAAAAAPVAIALSLPQGYHGFWQGVEYLVMGALVFAVLTSMRWRRVMRGMVFDLDQLRLASVGARFLAGLVDALPLLAVAPLMAVAPDESVESISRVEIAFAAALGLYVLHTAIFEAMTARSLGKMLLGLRVVALDGTRPAITSLVTRNILRVIDVGLFFLPLLVIFVSPLRQRTGDVAAGTLVVRDRREAPGEEDEGPGIED